MALVEVEVGVRAGVGREVGVGETAGVRVYAGCWKLGMIFNTAHIYNVVVSILSSMIP